VLFPRVGLTYNGACAESWGDTRIVARVPGGISSGSAQIYISHTFSNKAVFTVTYSYGGGKWQAGDYPQPMSEQFLLNPNTDDVTGTAELPAFQARSEHVELPRARWFQFRYRRRLRQRLTPAMTVRTRWFG